MKTRYGFSISLLIAVLVSLSHAGCQETAEDEVESGSGEEPAAVSEGVHALPPDAPYLDAPASLEVNGRTLSLETYLWRDFMPISPPGGKPLIASLTVSAEDGGDVPETLDLSAVRIVHGDSVWAVPMDTSTGSDSHRPTVLQRVARGGPKWGPGVSVDVYVELHRGDEPLGWLAARAQPIDQTH